LDLFDVIVDATHTGILKPDPRAYAFVTEALGLPAAACVFVDDQQRNVDGGRAAGMRTVHFDVSRPVHSYAEALGHFDIVPAA
ncbi:MAG: HAD family phosphatase, partial [Mesorhizobium sp.]